MIRATILAAAALAFLGCQKTQDQAAAPSPEPALLSGWSDDILTLNGVFAGHREQVMIETSASMVWLDCPVLGELEVPISRKDVPAYGFVATWTGEVDEVYTLQISVESYGRMFVTVSDGGEMGRSNTIGWRFDPWAG